MKRKLHFLTKTLLVAVMLCIGASNAWADPIETIGTTSSGWWTAFSSTYTLEGYGSYNFKFTTTNANDGNGYKTWLLVATNGNDSHGGGGTEYFAYRADGYAWGQGKNSNPYNETTNADGDPTRLVCSNTYSGSNLQAAMNGASVDVTVTRKSTNISLRATVTPTNGDSEFTMSFDYLYGNATSENIGLFLTVQNAQVVLNTAEQTASWSTVWATDFSSAPSGMTYSVTNGNCAIAGGGYLYYNNDGAGAARAINTAFTGDAFNVDTDWIMEFDWNCHASNTTGNTSNVAFATNSGTAFTITWNGNAADPATITDASSTSLTTTLPTLGTANRGTFSSSSHFTITGIVGDGVYLTVTKGGTTYVNNQKVSSTYGYPASFNGSLGRAYAWMYLDNISFKTPTVAGFVATPTSEITGASGTSRKFTLSCLTDGVTIYYATSDLEKGAAGWNTYTGEVTTAATTIYAYAKKGSDTSDKMNFATGAGTTINLAAATVTHSNNGVYTIANDQSAILGAPTATIHYQIDGGSEQTSTNASVNVNIAADGTLTYWLTAEGYGATDPANETVYAPRAYATTTTLNFCTNSTSSAAWAYGNATNYDMSTITVATVNTDRTYYKYLDQSGNVIGNGMLAVSAENEGSSWRIDKSSAGVHPYNKTEYVVLLGMEAGQLIQIAATSAPSSTSNLTAVPAATYTGTYTYTATADGEVIFSLAKNVVLKTIKLCSTSVSATIGTTGYTTFASPYALNLSGITSNEGTTTAYYVTASDVKSSSVALTEATGNVAAGTGLILNGTAGATVTIPVVASGTDLTSTNMLKGCTVATDITSSTENYGNFYVLGASVAEFQKIKTWVETPHTLTIPAGKAYLDTTGANVVGAPTLTFDFGETTGINTVQGSKFTVNGEYYDLQGRRVAQPTKGLYIVNGRKVVIK